MVDKNFSLGACSCLLTDEVVAICDDGYVTTLHILLAILENHPNTGTAMLELLHVDCSELSQQVQKGVERRKLIADRRKNELRPSAPTERAFGYALEEAQILGCKEVGLEHIVIGLLRCENSFASLRLIEAGLTLNDARCFLAKKQS